jgi:hypothetical protein
MKAKSRKFQEYRFLHTEHAKTRRRAVLNAGLLISNIDIDIDTIDDTFQVSISTILSCRSIESSIDDTFTAVFLWILRYRYFVTEVI